MGFKKVERKIQDVARCGGEVRVEACGVPSPVVGAILSYDWGYFVLKEKASGEELSIWIGGVHDIRDASAEMDAFVKCGTCYTLWYREHHGVVCPACGSTNIRNANYVLQEDSWNPLMVRENDTFRYVMC